MIKKTESGNSTPFNVIGKGCKITGQIMSDNDFRIDGTVEGEITCNGKVVLGTEGRITGPLTCVNAEILGTAISNNIQVSDTLILRSTAKIAGNVQTKILVVEPNAIFDGTCSMQTENTNRETVKK
jgi:cytoskeletal protein CcmA (bactofilin family)